MKLSDYEFNANISTLINGKPNTGEDYRIIQKSDVLTFVVNKYVYKEFVGTSQPFDSKLEAWNYLCKYEEGKIS